MSAIERYVGRSPAHKRQDLATLQAIQAVRDGAVVRTTRIDADVYVASRAMSNIHKLNQLEAAFTKSCPCGAERYAVIVDCYTMTAAQVVAAGFGQWGQ